MKPFFVKFLSAAEMKLHGGENEAKKLLMAKTVEKKILSA